MSMFGSTYRCEQLFSLMKGNKSPIRSRITDVHLGSVLKLITANKISPEVGKMCNPDNPSGTKNRLSLKWLTGFRQRLNQPFDCCVMSRGYIWILQSGQYRLRIVEYEHIHNLGDILPVQLPMQFQHDVFKHRQNNRCGDKPITQKPLTIHFILMRDQKNVLARAACIKWQPIHDSSNWHVAMIQLLDQENVLAQAAAEHFIYVGKSIQYRQQRDYLYDPFLGSLDHAYTHSSAFSMPSLAPLMPSLMTPLMPSPMAPQMPPLMPTSLPRPICPPTHDTVQSDKVTSPIQINVKTRCHLLTVTCKLAALGWRQSYNTSFGKLRSVHLETMVFGLMALFSPEGRTLFHEIQKASNGIFTIHQRGQSQTQGNAGNWKSGNKSYAANRSRGGDKLKFSSEYDFEQANAEFQELEVKMAKTRLSDEDKETSAVNNKEEAAKKASENSPRSTCDSTDEDQHLYYDKKKSFFDTISCESTERMKEY
ncbi:LSM14A, partial [Cordylochernes scorpioides]